MQLDDRKWTILKAIIKTYLETGVSGSESQFRHDPQRDVRSGRYGADHSTSYIVRTYSFGRWIPALCRPADG